MFSSRWCGWQCLLPGRGLLNTTARVQIGVLYSYELFGLCSRRSKERCGSYARQRDSTLPQAQNRDKGFIIIAY